MKDEKANAHSGAFGCPNTRTTASQPKDPEFLPPHDRMKMKIPKFLFPALRGAGRFEKMGLPEPEFLGYFVGSFEIVCGFLILIGFVTRLASIPLITIMLVAIATTKTEILAEKGLWEMLHGSRTDWSMLPGSLFLLIKGSGRFSIDRFYFEQRK